MKIEDGILILERLDQVRLFFEDRAKRSKDAPVELWGPSTREGGFFGYLLPPGSYSSQRGGRFLATEQSNGCVRVRFELWDFPDYDLFWREVSSLEEEMKQRGFRISESSAPAPAEDAADLDPLNHKIIEVVRQIKDEGLRATDELVAKRLPVLSPLTGQSYHRVTINRRRCKLRDNGYKV